MDGSSLFDIAKVAAPSGLGGAGLMGVIARFLWGDARRLEAFVKATQKDIYVKLEEYQKALNQHEIADAEKWASRTDLAALRDHIDSQFVDQRNFFLQLIKGKP